MTILYLYYNQPEAIIFFESLGYPDYDCKFVFVDDGSRDPLKLDWSNATVLRIEDDIHWNQPTANNIGFKNLSGIVLRMDIDHYLTPDAFNRLKNITLNRGQLLKFNRRKISPDGTSINILSPPNIYMINAEDYWEVGGYDELYVGNYGYEDADIRRKFDDAGFITYLSDVRINVDTKFETKGLSRDRTINYNKFRKKWRGDK